MFPFPTELQYQKVQRGPNPNFVESEKLTNLGTTKNKSYGT